MESLLQSTARGGSYSQSVATLKFSGSAPPWGQSPGGVSGGSRHRAQVGVGLRAVALGSSQGAQGHPQGGWEEREVRGEV